MNVPMETPSRILRRIKADYNESIDSLPPPIDEDSHEFSDLQSTNDLSRHSSRGNVSASTSQKEPSFISTTHSKSAEKSRSTILSNPTTRHSPIAPPSNSRQRVRLAMRSGDENVEPDSKIEERKEDARALQSADGKGGESDMELVEPELEEGDTASIPSISLDQTQNSASTMAISRVLSPAAAPSTVRNNSRRVSPAFSSPSVARGASARSQTPMSALRFDTSSPPVSMILSPQGSPGVSRNLSAERKRLLSPSASSAPMEEKDLRTPARLSPSEDNSTRSRAAHLLSTLRATAPRAPFSTNRRSRIAALKSDPSLSDGNVSATSNSSLDLTTRPRGLGNTSLPNGLSVLRTAGTVVRGQDPQTRFNNLKLNTYLHKINTELTKENAELVEELAEKEREVEIWKRRALGEKGGSWGEGEQSVNEERLESIRDGMRSIGEVQGKIVDELLANQSHDDLKTEVEGLRKKTEEQEQEMNELREELLLERQSKTSSSSLVGDLQRTVFQLKDSLAAKADIEGQLRIERERVDELLSQLEDKDRELDEARVEIGNLESDFSEKMHQLELDLLQIVEDLEEQLKQVKESEEEKQEEIEQLNSRLKDLSKQKPVTSGEEEVLRSQIKDLKSADAEAKRNLVTLKKQMNDLEEALDESERQMVAYEEDIANLKQDIKSRVAEVESVKRELIRVQRESQYASTRSNSPPTKITERDVGSQFQENQLLQLRQKLEAAEVELDRLRDESPITVQLKRELHIKDMEIENLQKMKEELENRVATLKQQTESTLLKGGAIDSDSSAQRNQTSFFLRSIRGIRTPKTPGHYMSHISVNATGSADATISPLLQQIEVMEQEIDELKDQLGKANEQVDDKLSKLENAGFATLSISTQLLIAKDRISHLENKLETFIGKKGLVENLKNLKCPNCSEFVNLASTVKLLTAEASLRNMPMTDEVQTAFNKAQSDLNKLKAQWENERTYLASQSQQNLDNRISEIQRLKSNFSSKHLELQELTDENRRLSEEKEEIVREVEELRRDLERVKFKAARLGDDLAQTRSQQDTAATMEQLEDVRGKLRRLENERANHVCQMGENDTIRHKDESKGLLAMIHYLKLKFGREAYFRADLAHQKTYMILMLDQKQAKIDSTVATLAEFGFKLPRVASDTPRSFKVVATAVLATCRMSMLLRQWKAQCEVKKQLLSAYHITRGRPYPSNS